MRIASKAPHALVLFAISSAGGCLSPWFSKDENLSLVGERREAIKQDLQGADRPTIIAQIASPSMLTQSRLENVGLLTQLRGTGGAVDASPQREKMLDTMRRKEADRPNAILDDSSTALVVASAVVPPAAEKGQELDIVVRLSSHAQGTDLHHGWLMETPLMEMSVLGGRVREGFELAVAQGYLVTERQMTGSEEANAKLNGVIIGGGKLLEDRELGITLNADFADAVTMSAIVPAINKRFTIFSGGKKTGVATPQDDSFLAIKVPPRYRLDPFHFINVVTQASFNELPEQRAERLASLRKQLKEPTTVRKACWQLEALGEESIPMLRDVLAHPDPEIRFYAAHSLAYLNDEQAVPTLVTLCRQEPAFRAMCLNALTIIDSYEAGDALRELLHAANAEVKYGAVLALRKRDASDPEVTPRPLRDCGRLLEIPSSGPPLVAASLMRTPEIVIFGNNPQLHISSFIYASPQIIVSPLPDNQLTISSFRAGQDDRVVNCPADLRSVLESLSEVGGTYGDCVDFLRQCHEAGYLTEPFALNPVPQSGRKYERKSKLEEMAGEPGEPLLDQTFIAAPSQATDGEPGDDPSEAQWFNPLTWTR